MLYGVLGMRKLRRVHVSILCAHYAKDPKAKRPPTVRAKLRVRHLQSIPDFMWSRSDLESSSEDKGSVAGYKPREDGTEGGKGFIETTKRGDIHDR
jgi:hypothetical protein